MFRFCLVNIQFIIHPDHALGRMRTENQSDEPFNTSSSDSWFSAVIHSNLFRPVVLPGRMFLGLAEDCPSGVASPREMDGYAFIAHHRSWNRDVPTWYKVVYVEEMDKTSKPTPTGLGPHDLLTHQPPNAKLDNGFLPVNVDFDDYDRLLLSSDDDRRSNYEGCVK